MATVFNDATTSEAESFFVPPSDWTVADLLDQLGDIPAARVRMTPYPGTATEKDVIDLDDRGVRLCELVDGTLVEKPMGVYESWLAARFIIFLGEFVERHNLGIVLGEAGFLRLFPGTVRAPDVAFIRRQWLPDGRVPRDPIPTLAPNLAIEVISASNTKREMERKLLEYFTAGAELVWYVYPETRSAVVHTAPDHPTVIDLDGRLSGGDVLPGFELPLRRLFSAAESL